MGYTHQGFANGVKPQTDGGLHQVITTYDVCRAIAPGRAGTEHVAFPKEVAP